MENKKVDDPGALALRRLVRSPTGGRIGPRRSSTIVSSSSSASSVTSTVDAEMPASCVSRNTSSDECALHRFIVWAAVKRNACQKMTPEERRECPLLRCRKRFPNHELMLQHLYSCDHLAGGEYWCYDCERPEQLSDVKCRRYLGHPSKRRKIMTMAKSFFSSLGHKPKSHGLALSMGMNLGMGSSVGDGGIGQGSSGSGDGGNNSNAGGGMDEPPSYDSVLFTPPPPPPQAELFSTEIHEIGSSEVLLPTIPECETETEPIQAVPAPRMIPCLPPSTFPISPPGSHPGAVPLPSTMEAGFINWRPSPPSPPTVAPQSLMKPATARLVDRPTLQVNTHLDQYRGQARRRSKALAPSSSVRSTSSTDSTDSTESTASYNISPMSGWSSGWTKTSGFESALTSPDDLISPQSLLPAGPFVTSHTTNTADASSMRPVPFSNSEFENIVANSCPSELPADIPMFDDLPTTTSSSIAMDPHKTQAPMGLDHSAFSFNTNLQFQLPLEHQLPPTNTVDDLSLHGPPHPSHQPPLPALSSSHSSPQQTSNNAESSMMQHVGSSGLTTTTQSLARSAQDALRMHIVESRSKIDDINENRLMVQLCQMPLASVATVGLETMVDILEGRQASSPLNLLCFVHVVFSLSLVVHEQEASKHVGALFKQALLYSDWFSDDDKMLFIEVVYTLWKPSAVRDEDIIELLKSRPSIAEAAVAKGKQPERSLPELRSDPLVLVAAYFLDELEYMALSDSNYSGQPFEIALQHIKDSVGATHDSPFAIAARFMIVNIFAHQYSHFPGFELGMEKLIGQIDSGEVATVRRLELELMQAGKTYLPSDAFFDDFIEVVRRHTDSLYTQGPYFSPRSTYHRCGIQLLLSEYSRSPVTLEAGVEPSGASGAAHGIVGVVPGGFDSFFDDMVNLTPGPGLDVDNMTGASSMEAAEWTVEEPAFVSPAAAAAGSAAVATPVPQADEEALISPVVATPSKADPSASTSTKVESDNCCKICGYRPKGDPRWFAGSMAKHMRTIHSDNPQIFRCPYPGCTSQYSKRADNLRQHQIEKGHFVDDEGKQGRRPRKRKRPSEGGGEC